MKTMLTILTTALMLSLPLTVSAVDQASAERAAPSPEQQVDALFAKWSKRDVPGAAVVIIRDSKVVLSKGYGMADLERAVPITSETVFNVGSISKQFTAFAIQLLAQEGKLSLDDDMRKYLPDMPDLKHKITIRHLLHHTSGLRDASNLLFLAGWRYDDVAITEDILTMLARQRTLNFAPGTEHLYNNTGYVLLAAIVERVSGKPLAKFAQERIFEPLGMQHTRFQANYSDLVPNRALSYKQTDGGVYQYSPVLKAVPGPSEVLTTAEDLARWDSNFDDGRVGGKALQAKILEDGQLNSGKPVNYASGLYFDTYRGLKVVEHLGTTGGYASFMTRFPDQHFTVIVLANARSVEPTRTARRIADIFLDRELAPKPVAAPPKQYPAEVKLDQSRLDALTGFYALSPQSGCDFTAEQGRMMTQCNGQRKIPLFASGEREFFAKLVEAQLSFDAPGKNGLAQRVVLHQNGKDHVGLRAPKPVLSETDLSAYEGEYYSDELHVLYTIARKDGKLVMTFPRGQLSMDYVGGGKFFVSAPVGVAIFDCTPPKGCTGFKVHGDRVRELQFTKVSIVASGLAGGGKAKPAVVEKAGRSRQSSAR